MESKNPGDLQKVVQLLQKLSVVDAQYPADMFAQRHALFLDKVSAVKTNMHIETGKVPGSSTPPFTSGVLFQGILAALIIIEIAVGAYLVRDQWLPLLRPSTPTLANPIPLQIYVSTPEPMPSALPTETVVPTEVFVEKTSVPLEPNAPVDTVVPEKTKKENPGEHLGQTPGPPDTSGQNKGH